jgi:hypothetical protein
MTYTTKSLLSQKVESSTMVLEPKLEPTLKILDSFTLTVETLPISSLP